MYKYKCVLVEKHVLTKWTKLYEANKLKTQT